MIQFAEEISAG